MIFEAKVFLFAIKIKKRIIKWLTNQK
jgi:hypothetical protein